MYYRRRSIVYWLTTILQGPTYSIAIYSTCHGYNDNHHAHRQYYPRNHDDSGIDGTLVQLDALMLKILCAKLLEIIEFNPLTCYNKRKNKPARK